MSVEALYPVGGPPAYLAFAAHHPALSLQFLPSEKELEDIGLVDPIGDQIHQKTGMLIHRYAKKALFIPTSVCPIQCRYCFRKNELHSEENPFSSEWEKSLEYLKNHSEINEIIFTGGDPFMLSDTKIEFYLNELSTLSSIHFIRFHTRTPVIIPARLTSKLKEVLSLFKHRFLIQIVLHTNHPEELTSEFKKALADFYDPEIQWLSQSVLLKNVNDQVSTLAELCEELYRLKIRPYYLHHPDQVKGAMHFYLPLEEGRKIYHGLRGQISSWMLPHYVIDIPGGHGKTLAYNPEQFNFSGQLIDKNAQTQTIPLPT
jgi:lysine 2,3-aminomutase